MVFSSLTFLGLFLPISILLYLPVSRNIRAGNLMLILMSVFFYAFGDLKSLPIIIVLSILNFTFGIVISKEKHKKFWLLIGAIINLSVLVYYKSPPGFWGLSSPKGSIPLGLSFFTFQNLSYLADIYKNPQNAESRFSNYFLYILFFPQLIAGPIVKYRNVRAQFDYRSFDVSCTFNGISRFSVGLFKKVILAEGLSVLSDAMFDSVGNIPLFYAWLGAVTYALRLYYDFSGYSDMAVGLAGIFGFKYPENFDHPYIASSVSEFFRRWHITLFDFFKEYVYIPLGGNRHGLKETLRNTMIIFILTGFWHGFKLTYIVWGLISGIIVCLEKIITAKGFHITVPVYLRRFVTFIIVTLCWVIFRSDSLQSAVSYYISMFTPDFDIYYGTFFYRFVNIKYLFLIAVAIFCSGPHLYLKNLCHTRPSGSLKKAILTIFLYISSLFVLIESTYKPFIYFKF